MGVPVITLVGDTPVGRAGWSQLSNLELEHLAARDSDSFVQIAIRLCARPPGVVTPAIDASRAHVRVSFDRFAWLCGCDRIAISHDLVQPNG